MWTQTLWTYCKLHHMVLECEVQINSQLLHLCVPVDWCSVVVPHFLLLSIVTDP